MANITFYLKSSKPDKKGLKPILIQITHDYKRVRITSGEKIKPAYWNKKKNRAYENKDLANDLDYVRINAFLNDIEAKFKNMVSNAKLKDIELTESFLKENLFKGEIKKKITFFEVFNEYIETNRNVKAANTIVCYETIMHFLQGFEKDTKYTINLNAIDFQFFDKLKEYAYTDRGILDNYFAKIIKVVKSMLNWAKDREYYTGELHKKFKASEIETEVIYLRIDELLALFELEFTNIRLEKARDLFCFGCFTGLRVSDSNQLTRENIIDGVIHKTIQKTKKVEKIPLNSYALQILAKYKDQSRPLPKISSYSLNVKIKECCKLAGIEDEFTTINYSGSKKVELTKPKYKFVTTHTARKTFVTNSFILGMNTKTIKSITGHKLDSTFERYMKVAEDFKASEMDNAWGKLGDKKVGNQTTIQP